MKAKQIPILFIKQYLFWMLFFQFTRAIFLFYFFKETGDSGFWEILKSFWYSIYLDNSTTCYYLGLPFFLLFFQSLIKWRGFNIINLWYTYLLIVISLIISIGEIPIYREWHVKLNFKAVSYFEHPSEVIHTARWSDLIIGMLAIVLLSAFFVYMYRKWIHMKSIIQKRNYYVSVLFFLVTPVLLGLGIRGGLMPIPIHQSDVFYSKNNFLNLTAVNSEWNLLASIVKNHKYKDKNPFIYYPLNEARKTVDSLYSVEKDTTIEILTTKKPNIVLILLESWSADLVHSCGGFDSITPNFEKLIRDGFLFSKTYGSGTLSDQGIAAVLCGYPTLPNVIIVNQPDKYVKIPCFPRDLQKNGYHTSFMYGGQLSYGNIKGLIYYNQFDDIFEGKDFPTSFPQGRLGVHDQYMLDFWLKRMNTYPSPFFAAAFTLSSHSPYDQPFPEVFNWGGEAKEYINSAYYTDSCLGDFFAKAKKQDWYKNTLFVLVADHSHNSPRGWNFYSKNYRQIPMLLYGDVIKPEYRGNKMDTVCSQTDLAATILAQLGINHSAFKWSNNLFNPYIKHFGFFGSDAGTGWVDPENNYIFEYENNSYFESNFTNSKDSLRSVRNGKSYLETLFQEYLDL